MNLNQRREWIGILIYSEKHYAIDCKLEALVNLHNLTLK